MRAGITISAALLALFGTMLPCVAAQDPKPPGRVPRLTTDDVTGARSQSSSTYEAGDATPAYPMTGMSRYSPGNMGISLELPAEPQPQPVVNPQPKNKYNIKEMHKYLAASGPMSVLITSITFLQQPSPSQLEEFQTVFMNGVREQMIGPYNKLASRSQVSAANPEVHFSQMGDSRVSVTARYTVGGRNCVQSGLIEERDSKFLAVVTTHFAGDEKAKAVAQRVLASAYFQ
jgi:hypothetical protein